MAPNSVSDHWDHLISNCKESCRLHLEASPVLVEWHRTLRTAANSAVLVANSICGHEPHSSPP
ncbi:hypothetical protein JMJ77_0007680, partial [Colletotrichum scovillei]